MADNIKPTAEEQLPPLGIVFTEEMRESQTARYAAILEERERQLLAALRSNRELILLNSKQLLLNQKAIDKIAELEALRNKSLTFDRITYLLNEWGQYQARNMFLKLEASLKTQEKP